MGTRQTVGRTRRADWTDNRMNRREILRTGEGASDAEARRALRHVVVGEHADGPGHAGAEELVARRGEDSEEEPAFGERSAKNVTTGRGEKSVGRREKTTGEPLSRRAAPGAGIASGGRGGLSAIRT